MKLQIAEPGRNRLDLTPLIDIIFQLVIFFMIASTFVEDYGFNIHLPQASKPDVIPAENAMWVLVRDDGAVAAKPGAADYANPEDLVADLRRYAENQARDRRPAVVVIKADRSTPYERVIQVWNAARLAGIGNVSFKLEHKPRG